MFDCLNFMLFMSLSLRSHFVDFLVNHFAFRLTFVSLSFMDDFLNIGLLFIDLMDLSLRCILMDLFLNSGL